MALKAQVILNHESNMPEDQVVNTFHIVAPKSIPNADQICERIQGFYNAVQPGTNKSVGQWLSSSLSRLPGDLKVKIYDTMVGGQGPYREKTYTLSGLATGEALPAEVAVCLSYKQGNASGDQGRRQRGRIYVGPLTRDTALLQNGIARPHPDMLLTLRQAATQLATGLKADFAGGGWAIHSEYGSTPGSNPANVQADYLIDKLWTDDAFDIQRRRGEKATARVVVPV